MDHIKTMTLIIVMVFLLVALCVPGWCELSAGIDEVYACQKNVRVFRSGELYGLMHEDGTIICQPQFSEIFPFENGWANVQLPRQDSRPPLWNFVDANGNFLIDLAWIDEMQMQGYELVDVWREENSLFQVCLERSSLSREEDSLYGIWSEEGYWVIEPQDHYVYYENGYIILANQTAEGENSSWIFESDGSFLYEIAGKMIYFSDELIVYEDAVGPHILNKNWHEIYPKPLRDVRVDEESGYVWFDRIDEESGAVIQGYMNDHGEILFETQEEYDLFSTLVPNRIVYIEPNFWEGSCGLLDENGVALCEPKWRYITGLTEEIFYASDEYNDYLLDEDGQVIAVCGGGRWQDVGESFLGTDDPKDNIFLVNYFYQDGVLYAENPFGMAKDNVPDSNKCYVFVDAAGNPIHEGGFEYAYPFQNGYAIIKGFGDEGFCVIDRNFNVIREYPQYKAVLFYLGNLYARETEEGHAFRINELGEKITPLYMYF